MRMHELFENDPKKLRAFHQSLGNAIKGGVSQMQADFAIQMAKNPDQWKFKKGDQVYSKSTGKVYTITNLYYDSNKQRPMYFYSADDGESTGTFIADLANKSLIKINEAATAGATSSGSIATVVNPGMTNPGKNVSAGKPGKMAAKGAKQVMPKQQKPTDNALDSNAGLMTGVPIKR